MAKRNASKRPDAFVSFFLSLPIEIIDLIIPDPAKQLNFQAHSTDFCDPGVQGMCQLPIKRKPGVVTQQMDYIEMQRGAVKASHEPVRALLFALSHTCRALRAYCLPLLWRVLHVGTVEELGSLRDLFRASPSLPAHVKHFAFTWDMGGELCNEDYDREINAEPGETLVSLAFTDRAERERRRSGGMRRTARSGPDGRGPDERIADAFELNDCLTEVISGFTRLEALRWATHIMPPPEAAMAHLEKLETLQSLWVTVYLGPAHHHGLPLYNSFYRCAKNLDYLDLRNRFDKSDIPKEIFEADIWAAKEHTPPSYSLLTDKKKKKQLAAAQEAYRQTLRLNNTRTIINAARGGKLRYLFYIGPNDVFAIRALLPAWVGVICWDAENARDFGPWLQAAASLRTCLTHFARWYADTSHKRLTGKQVQSMPKKLMAEEQGASPEFERYYGRLPPKHHPLQRYFNWLEKDADVAQQVADAWNAVVAEGEALRVKCYCKMCMPATAR